MAHLYNVFLLGGIFCSFICSIILFRSRSGFYTNHLLGIILFLTSWYVLLFSFVMSGQIDEFPVALRSTGYFYFLVPPLSYIYVRSMIYREERFKKTDWIHFVLAGLIFVDYIPYPFNAQINAIERLAGTIVLDLKTTYEAGAGFTSPFRYYGIRFIQGLVYIILQWTLICKKWPLRKEATRSPVVVWLIIFSVLGSFLYMGFQTRNIAGLVNIKTDSAIPSLWIISSCFFCLSVYLFFNPDILYNIHTENKSPELRAQSQLVMNKVTAETTGHVPLKIKTGTGDVNIRPKENISIRDPINLETYPAYAAKIEEYMVNNQAFLRPGISVHELASELEIPVRTLSHILNHHYNQRFNDFINTYRIDYIIDRFENGDWRHLTFEGLAKEAGFSSRSTFFAVFKKLKGITPSEYLNNRVSPDTEVTDKMTT